MGQRLYLLPRKPKPSVTQRQPCKVQSISTTCCPEKDTHLLRKLQTLVSSPSHFEPLLPQRGQPCNPALKGASGSARVCSHPKCTPNAGQKLSVWSNSARLPFAEGSVRGRALPWLDTAPGLPKEEQLLREDSSQAIQVQDLLSAPVGFAFLPHRCFFSFYFVAVTPLYPILFCGFFSFLNRYQSCSYDILMYLKNKKEKGGNRLVCFGWWEPEEDRRNLLV